MQPKIDIDQKQIQAFCEKWQIQTLYLFGSVLREDFGPESDVDVCVNFDQDAPWDLFDLVAMKDELEALFGRPVDFLEQDAIRNPYRRQEIEQTRRLIYEQG